MFVCLKYCLKIISISTIWTPDDMSLTYAKTLENSEDGDMTKLSLLLDHEMRC